jgi:hypothetical protein
VCRWHTASRAPCPAACQRRRLGAHLCEQALVKVFQGGANPGPKRYAAFIAFVKGARQNAALLTHGWPGAGRPSRMSAAYRRVRKARSSGIVRRAHHLAQCGHTRPARRGWAASLACLCKGEQAQLIEDHARKWI